MRRIYRNEWLSSDDERWRELLTVADAIYDTYKVVSGGPQIELTGQAMAPSLQVFAPLELAALLQSLTQAGMMVGTVC